MAQKRDMTDGEYDVYQKIHKYEHPIQEEKGKIHREKSNAARYRRKHHTQLKQQLDRITSPDDLEDWDDDQALDDYEFMAERELRNAKTHKQRLKRLARRREVESSD